MDGLCKCGCGGKTRPANSTVRKNGWVKGQPVHFIKGHARRRNVVDGRKACCLCGELKTVDHFQKSKWNTDGYDHRCRSCNRMRGQRARIESHGLTWGDYLAMLEEQNHACALCFRSEDEVSLGIDHSHKTGRVRGLLCRVCNAALGQLQDDPGLLRRAAEYIEARP